MLARFSYNIIFVLQPSYFSSAQTSCLAGVQIRFVRRSGFITFVSLIANEAPVRLNSDNGDIRHNALEKSGTASFTESQ